jgi:hypothetical protein
MLKIKEEILKILQIKVIRIQVEMVETKINKMEMIKILVIIKKNRKHLKKQVNLMEILVNLLLKFHQTNLYLVKNYK